MKSFGKIRRLLCLLLCLCLLPVGAAAAEPAREDIYVRPLAGGVAQVAMSEDHLVVLRSDGTVRATGSNSWNQCSVSGWSRVVKIWACQDVTLGLTQEGTVLSTCSQLVGWVDIADVAVYRCQEPDIVVMAGLKTDGTVILAAAGKMGPYPMNIGSGNATSWTDVVQIAACDGIYALTAEGTVLEAQPVNNVLRTSPVAHWKNIRELTVAGDSLYGISTTGGVYTARPGDACEKWKDVVRVIHGSGGALYGLTADGGIRSGGTASLSVLGLIGVEDLAGSPNRAVGLQPDGSVRFWPEPENLTQTQRNRWKDIEELICYPGSDQVAALGYDGTVVAACIDDLSQPADCDGWTNVARLYCHGQRWLALQEDGGLRTNFKAGNLQTLTADIRDTRPQEQPRGLMAAGTYHSVYLREDGRVSGAGLSRDGRLDVESWRDVTAVDAYEHTVAIHADGTVSAAGTNTHGRCDVSGWRHIVDISAGGMNTIGLTDKGAVVVAGSNAYGQHDLVGIKNVTMVEAGSGTLYILTENGTVAAAGSNVYGQANVMGWTDVVAISAGTTHVVALRSDGTVVAAGNDSFGQCQVTGWKDIVAISAGGTHTVGLKSDGTLVFTGSNEFGQGNLSGWQNVIALSTGMYHTLGLTSTGDILSTGSNENGQCEIGH